MSRSHASTPVATPDCAGECPLAGARGLADVRGIDRRTFISQSVLAAAALALASCMGGDNPTAPTSVTGSIKVSDYPALANVDGVALVTVDGAQLAVVRTGSDSFVALSRICPHQGATVEPTNSGFQCPRHGARFDETGRWIGGQPTGNMHAYPTAYDATSETLTIG